MGQTPGAVGPKWICNHTQLLSKKCLSGKTWVAVSFALCAQRNTDIW